MWNMFKLMNKDTRTAYLLCMCICLLGSNCNHIKIIFLMLICSNKTQICQQSKGFFQGKKSDLVSVTNIDDFEQVFNTEKNMSGQCSISIPPFPLKISENFWFSDVFSGHRTGTLAWNKWKAVVSHNCGSMLIPSFANERKLGFF